MANNTEQRRIQIIADGRQAEASINQITRAQRLLNAERNREAVGSRRYQELTRDLEQMNRRLTTARNEVRGLNSASQEFWKSFKLIAAGVVGGSFIQAGINAIGSMFTEAISKSTKLSDEMADIAKATNMTDAEVKQLNKSLQAIDTRTSTSDLRKMAVVAGQFGVANDQIAGFVESMDKANVALADEFGGNVENLAKELTGLRNVFTDIKTDNYGNDLGKISNAINELGAAGAATGPVVSDFSNRIGGVGIPLGLTTDQVLGLSATLQELNVTAERGGTAIGKILQKMTTNTAEFAKIAGMDIESFSKLVNTDLFAAFTKVVEGSKQFKGNAIAMGGSLKDLEISGGGVSEVFSKLSSNTGMLKEKVDLANESLKNTNSINAEFDKKNNNLAAKWEKVGKAINASFNSVTNGFAEQFINLMYKLIEVPVSEKMEEERKQLRLTELKLLDVNIKQEDRIKLIKELQEKYPDYLANINAETVTNDELKKSLDKVNASLINKIILQKKDEEILAQSEKVAERRMSKIKVEEKLLSEIARYSDTYGVNLPAGKTIDEKIKILLDSHKLSKYQRESLIELQRSNVRWLGIANEEEALNNKLLQEKEKLIVKLGMASEKSGMSGPYVYNPNEGKSVRSDEPVIDKQNKGTVGGSGKGGNSKPKKRTVVRKEDEKAQLTSEFSEDRLVKKYDFEQKLAAENAEAIKEINLDAERERIQAHRDMEKELMDEIKNLRRNAAVEVGQNMKQLALTMMEKEQQAKFNYLLKTLEEQRTAELDNKNLTEEQKAEINKFYDSERKRIMNDQARAEKQIALFKIAIDTGVAAVSALKQDPTGILSALIVAQGLAQAAMVEAREVPQFMYGGVTGKDDKKRYMATNVGTFSGGGVYSSPSVGLIGEKGSELVIPNYLYTAPQLANTMQALESMIYNAKPFASGGNTTNTTMPSSNKEMIAALNMNAAMMKQLKDTLDNGIKAKTDFVQSDYEKFTSRIDLVKQISAL